MSSGPPKKGGAPRATTGRLQILHHQVAESYQPNTFPQVLAAIRATEEQMRREADHPWFHRLPRHRRLLIASNWQAEATRLFAQFWKRGDSKSLAAFVTHCVGMRRQFEAAGNKAAFAQLEAKK